VTQSHTSWNCTASATAPRAFFERYVAGERPDARIPATVAATRRFSRSPRWGDADLAAAIYAAFAMCALDGRDDRTRFGPTVHPGVSWPHVAQRSDIRPRSKWSIASWPCSAQTVSRSRVTARSRSARPSRSPILQVETSRSVIRGLRHHAEAIAAPDAEDGDRRYALPEAAPIASASAVSYLARIDCAISAAMSLASSVAARPSRSRMRAARG